MLKDYQEKILSLLQEHETLLGELYLILAEQFTEQRDLWLSLAKDEKNHADSIKKCVRLVKEGKCIFNEGKVRTYTVNTSIKHIKEITEKAKNEELTLISALSHTRDIETAAIEKNFFKAFMANDDETRFFLKKIGAEASDHLHMVQQEFFKQKANKDKQ